jgi:hypothetical protein
LLYDKQSKIDRGKKARWHISIQPAKTQNLLQNQQEKLESILRFTLEQHYQKIKRTAESLKNARKDG